MGSEHGFAPVDHLHPAGVRPMPSNEQSQTASGVVSRLGTRRAVSRTAANGAVTIVAHFPNGVPVRQRGVLSSVSRL